jgi:hypothetical protein
MSRPGFRQRQAGRRASLHFSLYVLRGRVILRRIGLALAGMRIAA